MNITVKRIKIIILIVQKRFKYLLLIIKMDNKTSFYEISLDCDYWIYDENSRCYSFDCPCGEPLTFVEEKLKEDKIIVECDNCFKKCKIINYNHLA